MTNGEKKLLEKIINIKSAVQTAFSVCLMLVIASVEQEILAQFTMYITLLILLFVFYIILQTPNIFNEIQKLILKYTKKE